MPRFFFVFFIDFFSSTVQRFSTTKTLLTLPVLTKDNSNRDSYHANDFQFSSHQQYNSDKVITNRL